MNGTPMFLRLLNDMGSSSKGAVALAGGRCLPDPLPLAIGAKPNGGESRQRVSCRSLDNLLDRDSDDRHIPGAAMV